MASSPTLSAHWDLENATVSCLYESGLILQHKIHEVLPNVSINVTAYGDSETITVPLREELTNANIRFRDTTGEGQNGADRILMLEMLEFAIKCRGPSYVMLIGGDADYFRTFEAIRSFGHTTILLFQQKRISNILRDISHYRFWLEKLCENYRLEGPDGVTLRLELQGTDLFLLEEDKDPEDETSVIFWDMNTCPLPPKISQQQANDHLLISLRGNTHVTPENLWRYKIYGDQNSLPGKRRRCNMEGVEYIETRTAQNKKEDHLENRMIADMLTYAFYNKPPSTIVVLTSNENLTGAIHSLRNLGHKVILRVPIKGCHFLEDAATKADPCPKWGRLLNNTQETKAKKKKSKASPGPSNTILKKSKK